MYETQTPRTWVRTLIFAVALAAMLLSACGGAPSSAVTQAPVGDVETEVAVVTEPPVLPSTEGVVTESPPGQDDVGADAGAGAEYPQQPLELGDPALKATDPGTVQLASGQVQLLEFFAFW